MHVAPVTVQALGYASSQYRIIRQPRPIGDDPLQMPANIIIDLFPRLVQQGSYDLVPLTTVVPKNISAGTQTVTPVSMPSNITVGANLLIGVGPSQEIVTALAVTGTTFTAKFTFAHAVAPFIFTQPPAVPVIVLPPNQNPAGLPYQGYLDIMFSPDGRVLGPLAGYDKIILWVRDVTVVGAAVDPAPAQNDPALVCIYPRTGLVAAHPVDSYLMNLSPYTFTTTGRRSSQ
jgi:hypothetical protein